MRALRILTKIHHYRLPVLGLCGFILTAALSRPGTNLSTIGPIRFDMFYVSVGVFGILILSIPVLDEYNPQDYGLEHEDSESNS